MTTLSYVIVEEPTEAEPTKFPRQIGKTSDLTAAENNCLDGEILVTTNLPVNVHYWEGIAKPTFRNADWNDSSNFTRMYCVCLVDDVPVVMLTEAPWKMHMHNISRITATLTIS